MGNPASNPGTEHFLIKDVLPPSEDLPLKKPSNQLTIGPGMIQKWKIIKSWLTGAEQGKSTNQ